MSRVVCHQSPSGWCPNSAPCTHSCGGGFQIVTYIDLKTLPEEHPLRNAKLDTISAEFKHCRSYEFTKVVPGRPLANDSYNDLEGVYASNLYQWRVPADRCTSTRAMP